MANPTVVQSDFPASFVTFNLKAQGNCISIGICMILYTMAYFGVQFWMRFKGKHNKEWVECQKKVWIMCLHVIGVYCYNSVSVATTVILWFATLASIGALALCVLDDQRPKLFKFVMSAGLGLTLINVIVHSITRAATSGSRSLGSNPLNFTSS
jgi:hypothetical protein